MGASTSAAVHGLSQHHAYSVLGIYTLSTGTVLVHMRNPWSSEIYSGSWRDGSSYWTQSVKNQLRAKGVEQGALDGEDDGHFFMPLHEFHSGFNSFTICEYKAGRVATYVEGSNPMN